MFGPAEAGPYIASLKANTTREDLMRLLTASLCLVAIAPLLAASQAKPTSANEAAVRDVVKKYMEARDARDPRLIEALFTPDADQQTTSGEWRKGRAQIVPGTLAASKQNEGTRTITVDSVRFITPDVAIADGPYVITQPGGAVRRMWATIVVVRGTDGWRISAIRNMVPTAAQ